nr:hypothetical protein [Sphingopyxis indica]
MTRPTASARRFTARPASEDAWVADRETQQASAAGDRNSARLTIDVTPALRGRMKVTAYHRGVTVAQMVRELLEREFPETKAGAS